LRDVSAGVRTDLMEAVRFNTKPVKSVYSPDDAFYLLTIPDSNTIYCFDVRAPLENGSFRATTWSGIMPLSFSNIADDGFYFGIDSGIVEYGGYLDDTSTYDLRYFTNPLDFQSPAVLKFLKKINLTVEGGANAVATLHWGYDYTENYSTQTFTFPTNSSGQFNVDEYNETAEYAGGVNLNTPKTNATGSGTVISMGVTSTINDSAFSVQKIDMLTITGRLL